MYKILLFCISRQNNTLEPADSVPLFNVRVYVCISLRLYLVNDKYNVHKHDGICQSRYLIFFCALFSDFLFRLTWITSSSRTKTNSKMIAARGAPGAEEHAALLMVSRKTWELFRGTIKSAVNVASNKICIQLKKWEEQFENIQYKWGEIYFLSNIYPDNGWIMY